MSPKSLLKLIPALLLMTVPMLVLTGCESDEDPFIANPNPGEAQLRVTHLSPDAPNVDIWVDGAVVLSDVPYTAVSGYLNVTAGDRLIQVTPTGTTEPIVIEAVVNLAAGTPFTVAATGLLGMNDLQPVVLVDDDFLSSSMARVRFVHTAPDAPAVDVAVTGGPVLFSNVPFRSAADYIDVAPGTYDLEVRLAGTTTVVLPLPGIVLEAQTNITVWAIGQVSDGSLGALPTVDFN